MGRNRTETAPSETAPVQVDRELDHLVCRDVAFAVVTRMRQPGVGQCEAAVQFLLRQFGVGRVDDYETALRLFDERAGFHAVRLGFDAPEVFAEGALVFQASLERVEPQRLVAQRVGIFPVGHESDLRQLLEQMHVETVARGSGDFRHHPVAHAVGQQVGSAVDKDRRLQRVAPVIVVREPPQRGLDAAEHDRRVGEQPLQDARVDRGRIVGPESGLSSCGVGVVAAQPFVGRVMVDHRVHVARRHAEEQPRASQLAEVAQVVSPVGLRHDRHAQALGLQQAADHGRTERRMIDIGVAREQNDVQRVPSACADFLDGRGQPVGRLVCVFFHGLVGFRFVCLASIARSV